MKGLCAMGIVLRFCVGFPFPNNYVEYRSLVGDVSRGGHVRLHGVAVLGLGLNQELR